jgi:hypothetical protein
MNKKDLFFRYVKGDWTARGEKGSRERDGKSLRISNQRDMYGERGKKNWMHRLLDACLN